MATIASLSHDLTEANKRLGAAEEAASKERTGRIAMERERDEAIKEIRDLQRIIRDTNCEVSRYQGMLAMLEQLEIIPPTPAHVSASSFDPMEYMQRNR